MRPPADDACFGHCQKNIRASGFTIAIRPAKLMRAFEETPYGSPGQSRFDRTTFMVVSEFSRTPALNPARGKDHNAKTNSVLLVGNGVCGGQVIGGSRLISRRKTISQISHQVAAAYNLKTNQVAKTDDETRSDEFSLITPEIVAAPPPCLKLAQV
jgi:uncharacterized protein (DUF1501 family)